MFAMRRAVKLLELVTAPTRDMSMSVDGYRDWHTAIVSDDIDFTSQLLVRLEPADKQRHLNGHFVDLDAKTRLVAERNFNQDVTMQCYRPLSLAVVLGSRRVLAAMLEHGADPTRPESNQDTILHTMISVASSYEDTEARLRETFIYFMSLLTKEQRETLLMAENALGLRPLEEAARLGCALLLTAIFQTPGVYLAKERTAGMLHYQWYDITDYELYSGGPRRGKSPLAFITYMTSEAAEKPELKDLLAWKPFQHWYNIKLVTNLPPLLGWSAYRVTLALLVMAMMTDSNVLRKQGGVPEDEIAQFPNATFNFCAGYTIGSLSERGTNVASITISVCALLGIAFDVGELTFVSVCRRPEFKWLQLRRGNVAVSFWFSRAVHFMFLLSTVVTLVRIADHRPLDVDTISDIGRLFFVISAFSSLFFFLELIPQVGFYILAIKRMLRDLFYFFLLYMICVSPFALYFMVFMNTNSQQGCIHQFFGYIQSFYTTFLVMLNMRDLTRYRVQNAFVLYLTHMIFVFMVGILLVNFLIATMSESGFRMSKKKEVLLRIERLHALFVVDTWFGWILSRYHRYVLRKLAAIENGRVYILNVQKIGS